MSDMEQAREAFRNAKRVLVVTGAGISAESGIPTFRGEGGLWKGFDATQLATPQAFDRDPALVWEWYRWRKQICNDAEPNAGHLAVAEMEDLSERFLLLTQNVDGLHPRAGSKKLVEIHGCIDVARCTECAATFPVPSSGEDLPHCSACGALARPHILWFGESYWQGTLDVGMRFARQADFVLVVGTSGMVWAPSAVALEAKQSGAYLVDVNPERSQISAYADAWLAGPSGEILPRLIEA